MWLCSEKISSSTSSMWRYYHRDRRFRFCLLNVCSMLTWVQSHKCRSKELANNISATCERRSILCSESGCFVILTVHRSTWRISRQSNRYNNNVSLARFTHVRHCMNLKFYLFRRYCIDNDIKLPLKVTNYCLNIS